MIEKNQIEAAIAAAAHKVRETNPMAGSITNTVTIDFVANAQLAVGGSAAMVYLPDEGEALVAAGNAVYLNMGTLFPIYEQTIPATAKAAHDAGKAWVLDPVGLGIGSLRTKLIGELKPYKPTIVRGNASEIIALASRGGCRHGPLQPRRNARRSRGRCPRELQGRFYRRALPRHG